MPGLNVGVKLNRPQEQALLDELRNLGAHSMEYMPNGVATKFFKDELGKLTLKLLDRLRKGSTSKLQLNPAQGYVLYGLWLTLPQTLFLHPDVMRKVVAELDREGCMHFNGVRGKMRV